MTRHTRPTYFGKASTKKQSEYKLINWCPDSLKVFVWRVLCAAHFLSVYFVIYLFILSSNWFFISCCSCSMRCHFFWILPAQTKRVSSSTIVCGTEVELTGPVFTATVCKLSGPTGHWKPILQDHIAGKREGRRRALFCESCEFRENCTQHTFFSYLAHHLRNRQTFPPWV